MAWCVVLGGAGAGDKSDVEKEFEKANGVWSYESQIVDGKERPANILKPMTMTYEGEKWTLKNGDSLFSSGTHTIDPSNSPKTVDITVAEGNKKGETFLGIYELDGDVMKACMAPKEKGRPTAFKSEAGSGAYLNVMKRVKK